MEIKKGTFVVIVDMARFGIVKEIDEQSRLIGVETVGQAITKRDKNMLIPLVEDCGEKSVEDILREENSQIIISLALLHHDNQKQIKDLQELVPKLRYKIAKLEETQEALKEAQKTNELKS